MCGAVLKTSQERQCCVVFNKDEDEDARRAQCHQEAQSKGPEVSVPCQRTWKQISPEAATKAKVMCGLHPTHGIVVKEYV